jgi:hypothetical protein
MIDRIPSMIVILVWVLGSIGLMCAQPSNAHDLYHGWLAPNGGRYCSDVEQKCRPVRSYIDDDGYCQILY